LTDRRKISGPSRPEPRFAGLIPRLFINAPFERLQNDLLRLFLDNRLQPEIGLEGSCLHEKPLADFRQIAWAFKDEGLACTIHAPFGDLAPGGADPAVLAATRAKLRKAFELIDLFEPVSIVCHLGYEENKHGYRQEEWLANSLETWEELLAIAESSRTPVAFENTYETSPDMHRRILGALDSRYARFCLDVGHVMAFAGNTWQDWLDPLLPWLVQLHLHDNAGSRDDHLAIGEGDFDFAGLFDFLRRQNQRPVITIEPHREEGLWNSLSALDDLVLPEPYQR
jgi:sugar phosphate isomerase/epimerase